MKKYDNCGELATIAEKILLVEIPNLPARGAKIRYLSFDASSTTYIGQCSRTTGKWKFLTNYDFVVEVYLPFWKEASEKEKEALVLHELLHIMRKEVVKVGGDEWALRKHDVEEFSLVVEKFGLWTSNLERMFTVKVGPKKEKEEERIEKEELQTAGAPETVRGEGLQQHDF